MAFVNIRGSMVDRAEWGKYNDIYVKAHGGKGSLGIAQWTLDRERAMLLVCLYKEREDMYDGNFHISRWVFYWRGKWIQFVQYDCVRELADNHFQVTRKIKEINLVDFSEKDRETFFVDMKDAFKEYKLMGAVSKNTILKVDLTLDLSEVL